MPELTPAQRSAGPRVFEPDPEGWAEAVELLQSRYGPPGTVDSPQYDCHGSPTGRQAGAAARKLERREAKARAAS